MEASSGGGCKQKLITLTYPQHRFTPEDLLFFIESTGFSKTWRELGLDDENDLESLQLCVMAHPKGDGAIPETGGLRMHHHMFGDWAINKQPITAYYAYFEDYGIVYLVCVDEMAEELEFSRQERDSIRQELVGVKKELDRLKTIR